MIIQTHKILGLWFVKNPYRRDLDTFCTEINDIIRTIQNTTMTGYQPVVYEIQFWLQTPKFKKLTKLQLKKLLGGFELSEKIPGRSKDIRYYNAAQKSERAYLPKRKTVRTYTKKKTLAAGKKILSAAQLRDFKEWIDDGNATEIEPGIWLEQTTQWRTKFNYEELQKFFKKEYL
jgi:hypothetical protein